MRPRIEDGREASAAASWGDRGPHVAILHSRSDRVNEVDPWDLNFRIFCPLECRRRRAVHLASGESRADIPDRIASVGH